MECCDVRIISITLVPERVLELFCFDCKNILTEKKDLDCVKGKNKLSIAVFILKILKQIMLIVVFL